MAKVTTQVWKGKDDTEYENEGLEAVLTTCAAKMVYITHSV